MPNNAIDTIRIFYCKQASVLPNILNKERPLFGGSMRTGYLYLGRRKMSKHTKGPWIICYDGNIDSKSGRSICAMGFSTYKEYNDQPEMKANARLIAAAPELLEACKEQMRVIETMGNKTGCWPINDDNLQMAKAAIAKAEGK